VCVGSGGERLLPEWYSEKGTNQNSLTDLTVLNRVSMLL